METGFPLPQAAALKYQAPQTVGATIGATIIILFLFNKGESLVFIAGLTLLVALIELAMYIWLKKHKYVFISRQGLKGKGTHKRQWNLISWDTPTTSRPATFNRLKGVMLISNESGQSIFIPEAIINHHAFQAEVAALAPAGHPLLKTETP